MKRTFIRNDFGCLGKDTYQIEREGKKQFRLSWGEERDKLESLSVHQTYRSALNEMEFHATPAGFDNWRKQKEV